MINPVSWFEIYVDDMSRAQKFYETVLGKKMNNLPMPDGGDNMQMVAFPMEGGGEGAAGSLVKMDKMKAGTGGTMVYFACEDCATEKSRVEGAGGKVYQPKMSIGEFGFCSICADTEDNSFGLHSMK